MTPESDGFCLTTARTALVKCSPMSFGLVLWPLSSSGVQGRRAVKTVPVAPKGTLHDYVPFYFAPRSPMLMTINSGNVAGCDYRQDDIVHLVSQAQTVRDGGHQFVFWIFMP